MAKQIIRYSLNPDGSIPDYVEDGGHFEYNGELVGISKDIELPPEVYIVTEQQVRDTISAGTFYKMAEIELTQEEKTALVDEFLLKLQ